jgi:CRISPR-associated protein Csb2
MLTLEVEFLTGVSVAAAPYNRELSEWPPHPDRLFQALVAAWGRNEEPDLEERAALEWLEALPMDGLLISAPAAYPRAVVTVFTPPNDSRTTGRSGESVPWNIAAALRVIPELRKNRQPRAFPAVIPAAEPAVIRYVWPTADALDSHRHALARLAAEVTYLGHSHTLVRVALLDNEVALDSVNQEWIGESTQTLRVPHEYRLRHLDQQYARSKMEPRIVRPSPSLSAKRFASPATAEQIFTHFDPENVMVFADDGGFAPSLHAFPLVAKRLRDTLLKTADREQIAIPRLLSGHEADRRPTAEPHIAIVPLADVGWEHSRGRLLGLALVWPRCMPEEDRKTALKVIASFLRSGAPDVPLLGSERDQFGRLHFGRDGSWQIAVEPESDRASLRFGRYARAGRRWATVLPVVLDRHPKDKPGEDLASVIVQACVNVGLPPRALDGIDIEIHKHSAIVAAPSVKEVRQALPADSRYRNKPLCHLVLTFPRLIRGPLLLGAGRFRGLGLCLPVDDGA